MIEIFLIEKVEIEEIMLLFVQLRVLEPIYNSDFENVKPLLFHLFIVKKFLANGEHDKMKPRMAANRNGLSITRSIITYHHDVF